MKSLITTLALVFAVTAQAQICPPDMSDIVTTEHSVLEAAGHKENGYNGGSLGDPNEHSTNWLNGIYNNFLTPQAEGHFFYQNNIYSEAVPFSGNDSEWNFGMCSSQGQCVQAQFQVDFNQVTIPAAIRFMLRQYRIILPAFGELPTTPRQANIRYTSPDGNQHSKTVAVNQEGKLPESQPKTPRISGQGGCLDNNFMPPEITDPNFGDDDVDIEAFLDDYGVTYDGDEWASDWEMVYQDLINSGLCRVTYWDNGDITVSCQR